MDSRKDDLDESLIINVSKEDDGDSGFDVMKKSDVIDVNPNFIKFPDGSQWSYITFSQDGLIKVNTEKCMESCQSNLEEQKTTILDGSEVASAEVVYIDGGQLAYFHPDDEEKVVQLSTNCQAVYMVAEPDVNDEKTHKKKNKTHVCEEPGCKRSYSSLHHLKIHVRNHTGDRPYACTVEGCSKAFATDYSRKSHLRTHTGEKPFSCPHENCVKSFKTSGDLQKHIRTHTGERPFMCPIEGCRRSFTTSNIRKVHIRTHTGERPYTCSHPGCVRTFASSTNYKNHMRIHSGEKPYSCTVPNCLKRFTEYSSLYKHQLVHSQHKRHQCPFCHKTYRQLSTLTTHKRVVHGVIAAEDGTEIILEQMIGIGPDGNRNFKNITTNLLSLKRDGTLIAIEEGSDTSVFIVSPTNDSNESELADGEEVDNL